MQNKKRILYISKKQLNAQYKVYRVTEITDSTGKVISLKRKLLGKNLSKYSMENLLYKLERGIK